MNYLWKLLFLPHERNNHKAYLIQPGAIAVFVAIYLLNQSFIRSFTIARPGVLGYSSEITAQKVYEQTNSRRKLAGKSVLRYNAILSESAKAKAEDMFANNYWAHNSPQGKTPWDFFKDKNYQYSVAGENLAKDFYDTDTMMRAWMNSPTHKANIINSKYQEIGIGVVNGVLNGVKTTLVVQHFATPLKSPVISENTEVEMSEADSRVLSDSAPAEEVAPEKLISPLQISKAVGSVMFMIIIGVLFIDGYHTLKNKTHRLSGSNAAHIGFLFIIFMLLLATSQGSILN